MAELVYGSTLRLPGELVVPVSNFDNLDPTSYVDRLRRHMSELKPKPARLNQRESQVHKDLFTCTHVFVRVDSIRKPLQPPYNGPYRVIDRTNKFFILDIDGKEDSVSVDRLKVAHTDFDVNLPMQTSKPVTPSNYTPSNTLPHKPVRFTRSGRRVRLPNKYIQTVLTD